MVPRTGYRSRDVISPASMASSPTQPPPPETASSTTRAKERAEEQMSRGTEDGRGGRCADRRALGGRHGTTSQTGTRHKTPARCGKGRREASTSGRRLLKKGRVLLPGVLMKIHVRIEQEAGKVIGNCPHAILVLHEHGKAHSAPWNQASSAHRVIAIFTPQAKGVLTRHGVSV